MSEDHYLVPTKKEEEEVNRPIALVAFTISTTLTFLFLVKFENH